MVKSWLENNRYILIVVVLVTLVYTGFINAAESEVQQSVYQERAAVLTFHSVSRGFLTNPMAVSQDELDKTFKLLKQKGYHPITLGQFHNFIDGKARVPDKSVLITFDDGYEDNYLLGYPVAKKYQVPAVIFAVNKWFSDYPRPEPHIAHLSAGEAAALISEGLWTIGNHSFDGHRKVQGSGGAGSFLTTIVNQPGYIESVAEYQTRIWNDISLSTFTLEKLGQPTLDFAFPYGSYNSTLKDMLVKSGYRYLYTNEPGLNKSGQDPGHIYRIPSGKTAEATLTALDKYFAQQK